MDWKSHVAIAIIATLAAFLFFLGIYDPFRLLPLALFAGVAALLPDIDSKESKGRDVLDLAVIASALALSYSSSCGWLLCVPAAEQLVRIALTALALLGLYFIFLKFAMPKHRGMVHTVASCLIFTGVVYLVVDRNFALAGFVGYFTHLAADNELKLTA